MNRVERHIQEERLLPRKLGHSASGGVADEMCAVTFVIVGLAIAVPIMAAVSHVREVVDRTEVMSVMMIEATMRRQIVGLHFAEMPFADHRRGIACGLQPIGNGLLFQR